MANYNLAQSFGRANIQDRLWYAQKQAELANMLTDTTCHLLEIKWELLNKI